VYAFSLLGYAPVPALATVVDGPSAAVFRMPFGDPHPLGALRVQFNVALCASWFGRGPWDDARPTAASRPASPSPGHPGHALASASHLQEVDLSETGSDARRSMTGSPRWSCGWQRTTRTGDTRGSRANLPKCVRCASSGVPRSSSMIARWALGLAYLMLARVLSWLGSGSSAVVPRW